MIINKRSNITGKVNQMDLPVTAYQIQQLESGAGYVQKIFSDLTPEQREFLMTGVTPEEWDKYIGPEPEE